MNNEKILPCKDWSSTQKVCPLWQVFTLTHNECSRSRIFWFRISSNDSKIDRRGETRNSAQFILRLLYIKRLILNHLKCIYKHVHSYIDFSVFLFVYSMQLRTIRYVHPNSVSLEKTEKCSIWSKMRNLFQPQLKVNTSVRVLKIEIIAIG